MNTLRQRALIELGLAPGWCRRESLAASATPSLDANAPGRVDIASLAFEELAAQIQACQFCARHVMRSAATAGLGLQQARLVVIDQVPVGAAQPGYLEPGQDRLFEQILFAIGIAREQVYLSHLARCDGGELAAEELSSCAPFLRREIELIAPQALLVLGQRTAILLDGIGMSGQSQRFDIAHPATMLDNAEAKRAAWPVLLRLRRVLQAGPV